MLRLIPLLLLLAAQDARVDNISLKEFQQRRTRLMEHLSNGPILIEAGHLHPSPGTDSNQPKLDMKYFTGIQPEGGILVLLPTEKEVLLFADGDIESMKKKTGVEKVFAVKQYAGFAKKVLYEVPQIYAEHRSRLAEALATHKEGVKINRSLRQTTAGMRLIKSEHELKLLTEVARITCESHKKAMSASQGGMNEGAIQKIIEDTYKKEGATGLGFRSIVGSGKNGTILHYQDNKEEMDADTLVVMDIGAALHGYAADITRTIPVGGKFSEEQKKRYLCVLDAQKAAEAILKPGVGWGELDAAARKVFQERGLTKWSYAHSRDRSVRHGLGHYVGLHVHDSGSYRTKMKPGMVITIEPGYYDKDAGYGIRIEDTYIVTKNGFERISRHAPRDVDAIEKWMKK